MAADDEKLRAWAAAERFAVIAEEMLRNAIQHHREAGGPAPSSEMQEIAAERRREADALFHALRDRGADE